MIDPTVRKPQDVVTLTWSAFAPGTDQAPDTDTEIDGLQAKTIYAQVDTTPGGNVSDDVDINVESSPDGTNWDSEPLREVNIGDNQLKGFLISPGAEKLRFRCDNNHASSNAAPVVRVRVIN